MKDKLMLEIVGEQVDCLCVRQGERSDRLLGKGRPGTAALGGCRQWEGG